MERNNTPISRTGRFPLAILSSGVLASSEVLPGSSFPSRLPQNPPALRSSAPLSPSANQIPRTLLESPTPLAQQPKVAQERRRVNAVGSEFYPQSQREAVQRVLEVKELYASGKLQEEVQRLGVSADWLRQHQEQKPLVAIGEHLLPLTSIFSKLGSYGSPAALLQALQGMNTMSGQLADAMSQDVGVGMLSSLDHLVAKSGLISGMYLGLPNHAKPDAPTFERVRLLSNRQLERYEGRPFYEVEIPAVQITELRKKFDMVSSQSLNAIKALKKSGADMANGTLAAYTGHVQRGEAVKHLWNQVIQPAIDAQAFGDCPATSAAQSLDYCKFVADFNCKLAAQIFPQGEFKIYNPSTSDSLAVLGVENWETFLRSFIDAGVIDIDTPVIRLKEKDETGQTRFLILKINELKGNDTTLVDRQSGRTYHAKELQDQAKMHYSETRELSMLPSAAFRYWAYFSVGNSIILEDGMPYQLLSNLHQAMGAESGLALSPRGLSIFPYTTLWSDYTPADPDKPYLGLEESYSVLDYLSFARANNAA